MPELPEVETTRRGIEPHLVGRQVQQLLVRQPQLRWLVPDELAQRLCGQTITAVGRRGKYLLLRVNAGHALVHLGMSGSLRLVEPDQPVMKHDHVDLQLTNGVQLRYTDPRRFGAWLWQAGDVMAHPLLRNLGPEPLSDAFTVDYLYAASRQRKQPVKTWIMDSKVVVGVGNIYANEALFMAAIRPQTPAGGLSRQRVERLLLCVKQVLARAIEQGGTTLKDFVGGDGRPGYFSQSLNVYGRAGEPCLVCQRPLKEVRLGQRSTVYCTQCQR